jgi:hypothetical protein
MFGLFESPDWSSFQTFPQPVQHDIGSLLLLDSLAKSSIAKELEQLIRVGPTSALATRMRGDASLTGELQICLLSTAVGKALHQVSWSSLAAERTIDCLGMLALCEFRNGDTLEGDLDVRQSGYSPDPDEARTQFLVLSAKTMDVADIEGVSRLSDGPFLESWLQLRSALFERNPRHVGNSASTMSVKETKSFQSLSPARRQLLLGLADGLAKKESSRHTTGEAARDAAPFDPERHKRDHPLLYVPVRSLIELMDQVASTIRSTVNKLPLDDYELRRLTRIKESLPSGVIVQLVEADVRALAYALVSAAAGEKEEKFIGCGVWTKITEVFQKRGIGDFQAMAEVQATGLPGEPGPGRDFSLAVNQVQACRRAAGEFLRAASSERQARLHLLFTGTAILRHVLNHPKLGPLLASTALRLLQALDPSMTELTRGELLDWDQQKDLPVS